MHGFVESDYSSDFLRWIKKLDENNISSNFPIKLNSLSPKNNQQVLEKLQSEIVKNGDAALAYFFAHDFYFKPFLMQKVILDKKDAKYAFMFAQHIKNCDIKALQNIVIESGKIKYITRFACHVKLADRALLEDLVIASKNVKYAHEYLKHVSSADINKFKSLIISSGKPRYLFELAKHCQNEKDIRRIEDLIINSGSYTYIRLLAEKIKLADVEKLEQAVLDLGNEAEIKKFARFVRRSKMRQFLLLG